MDKKRVLAVAGLGMIWSSAAGMMGCSSDDTSTSGASDSGAADATTAKDGSGADSSTRDVVFTADVVVGPDVTSPVLEAGTDAADAGTDGKVGDGATGTLYSRLGGHAGIRAAVDAVVGAEAGDPQILSYFFAQFSTPVPASSPTIQQIEECLTDQLAAAPAVGGPETYPTTVSTIVTDAGPATVTGTDAGILTDAGHSTWTCRDMASIHTHLHISGATFDRFVTIATGTLMGLGVTPSDQATISGVLFGTKAQIVDPALADGGVQCFPGPLPDGATPVGCTVPDAGDAGPTDAGGQ